MGVTQPWTQYTFSAPTSSSTHSQDRLDQVLPSKMPLLVSTPGLGTAPTSDQHLQVQSSGSNFATFRHCHCEQAAYLLRTSVSSSVKWVLSILSALPPASQLH